MRETAVPAIPRLRSLLIPVGFILLISIALIAGVAVYAARGQDRVAVEASIHLARSVLADVQRDLGRTLIDYSFWDEVAKNLVISPDLDWVDDNVGEYVHDELNIDTTFALDPAGRLIYGMIDGKRSTDDPNRQLSGGLDILVSQALTTAPTEYPVPFTGFLKFGDDIHIAAASEVKNYVFQDDTEIVVPTGSVMIFTRRLSDDLLMQISQDFLLAGLHFVPPTGAMSAAELPLATVDGAQLGHLTWEVASPGRRMLYQIMPGVAIAFLIIAGLTFLVLHRGQGIVHAAINYREMATRKQADEQLAQYQKVESRLHFLTKSTLIAGTRTVTFLVLLCRGPLIRGLCTRPSTTGRWPPVSRPMSNSRSIKRSRLWATCPAAWPTISTTCCFPYWS